MEPARFCGWWVLEKKIKKKITVNESSRHAGRQMVGRRALTARVLGAVAVLLLEASADALIAQLGRVVAHADDLQDARLFRKLFISKNVAQKQEIRQCLVAIVGHARNVVVAVQKSAAEVRHVVHARRLHYANLVSLQ